MTTGPAQGQSQADDGYFPAGKVYQQYRHAIRDYKAEPEKLDIPDVDISKHGTYESYPYYAFIEDNGKKFIVSDGRLLGQLTLIPGPRFRDGKDGTKGKWLTAKYKVDILRSDSGVKPSPGTTILSFNDPACGEVLGFLITKTDSSGTDISETDHYPDLPSGNNPLTCYRLKVPTPDELHDPDITPWGSSFTAQEHFEPLYYLTGSWNVKKLPYLDYQHQYTDRPDIFALPSRSSRNWWKATGALSLPWGWYFDLTDYSNDDTVTTMISTSRDLMNAMKRSTGFNVSGSVDVSYGFVDVEASFSYNSSNSDMTKFNSMQANKTAFTQSQYSHIEYAVVVNKIDLPLSGNFKEAIGFLLDGLEAGTLSDQMLTDFIETWGTHYAYALTYGSQGSGTYRFSEDQMSQMVEKGVNYSQAWEANAKVKVMGSGGSIGGGSSNETDNQMQSSFASIVQDSDEHYICSGGASCEGGEPKGDPKVPIYLDLRPISQLMGPPFYHDPKIVLQIRDRVHDAIQSYAFVQLQDRPAAYMTFELTFQPPGYSLVEGHPQAGVEVTWGEICISVDSGSLIPKANMQPSAANPSVFTLNFNGGLPKAVLLTHSNNITFTGTYSTISYKIIPTDPHIPGGGEEWKPQSPSLDFETITIPTQATPLSVTLTGKPNQFYLSISPTLQFTVEPVSLSSVIGASK
ncbi:MAC/perforin domain-containing protein [Synechococcus sp. BO 8801]|uniref:MAC/perforin domain-containing protein n=1 Tax=Synechococcus sp. BO 8801 TaxID=169670 RepID=UPI000B99BE09|nr:MAC/perforin domain-containing protein [Synechococcus sp. BO 8801]